MAEPHPIQILEPHVPNHVVCPYCGFKQPEVDLKPTKAVSIISSSFKSLITSNYLCKNLE